MTTTAKVFMSGRSQAVRIPKHFRFDCDSVLVSRKGSALVLTPLSNPSWEDFFINNACPDFEIDREEAQRTPERVPFA